MDQNRLFREAFTALCTSLDSEKALGEGLAFLRRHLPAVRISFHVYEPKSRAVETIAFANPRGSVALTVKTVLDEPLRRHLETLPAKPPVRIANDPDADPIIGLVARDLKQAKGFVLVMKLAMEGKILGFLAVTNDKRPYTTADARLLALLEEPFALALTNCLRYRQIQQAGDRLADDNRYLCEELRRRSGVDIVGAQFGLKQVMEMVGQVAPLASPVLLLGQTGVGKELIAGAIHALSPRRHFPLITVNCGAISPTLIDSELFGHEKGAFTGALSLKRGRFERADRGTIFLDEIGELPLEAQVRLLRVLQEKTIERVGGGEPIRLDLRIIAATHRRLDEMVQQGLFRQDLYFRLKVFPILVPPLAERRGDIPALVNHFIVVKSREMGMTEVPVLAPGAIERLKAYPWPGNVRELENAVERALILCRGKPLSFAELDADALACPESGPGPSGPEVLALDAVIRRHIASVLERCQGRIEGEKGAARLLGVHPATLRHRMRKLGIAFGRKAG